MISKAQHRDQVVAFSILFEAIVAIERAAVAPLTSTWAVQGLDELIRRFGNSRYVAQQKIDWVRGCARAVDRPEVLETCDYLERIFGLPPAIQNQQQIWAC